MLLICSATDGNNLRSAERVSELATARAIPNEVIDLTALELPLYSSRAEGCPGGLKALEAKFANASCFFIHSPEYNGSIPPVLTNTIAWLSTQSDDFRSLFNGKPVALCTYSGGAGQKVLVAMRLQFSHLGCNVVGREIAVGDKQPLRDASIEALLTQLTQLAS